VQLCPQLPRALPQVHDLVAEIHLAVAKLADQDQLVCVAVDPHEEVALVQAFVASSGLRSAQLPDLLCAVGGPDWLQELSKLRVGADALWRFYHQHHMAQEAARGAQLHEPAGALHEEDIAGHDHAV